MQVSRSVLAVALAGVFVAACGGSAATQAPAGATTNPADGGPGATENPAGGGAATENPGGGGGNPAGWDQYGKAHVEVTGPDVSVSKDLGFLPIASHFGGTDQTILYFTIEGTESVLTLTWSSGTAAASYVSPDVSTTGTECTTSNVNLGGSSASGSFDCTSAIMVLKSGATVEGGKLKGTFDAHG
jgi:hypothetical protein